MNPSVEKYLFGMASEPLLHELADQLEYWKKVRKFVDENRTRKVADLTPSQVSWLVKIREDLMEEASR